MTNYLRWAGLTLYCWNHFRIRLASLTPAVDDWGRTGGWGETQRTILLYPQARADFEPERLCFEARQKHCDGPRSLIQRTAGLAEITDDGTTYSAAAGH